MPTMKGVIVESQGGPWIVVDGIEVPEPNEDQILVKSMATAINPVENYMQSTGLLVDRWPVVLGCDASGTVVKAGSKVTSLRAGDRVCGCTRLGTVGHSTMQEFFLMDPTLAIRVPDSLSFHEAATIGVGTETACLGLIQGLGLDEGPPAPVAPKEEIWVIVCGGAGSVGQYSIQVAKAKGYKVVATCSSRTSDVVLGVGADAVVDYSRSEDEQLAEIKHVTGGRFWGVYDTVGKSETLGRKALREISVFPPFAGGDKARGKVYATTDDWTPMPYAQGDPDHGTYRVELGLVGRSPEEMAKAGLEGSSPQLNDNIRRHVIYIQKLLESGKVKPNKLILVEGGFEAVARAIELQNKGTKGGEKVVVKLHEE